MKIGLGSWSDAEALLDANIGGGKMGRCCEAMDAVPAFEAGAGPVKCAAKEP